MRKLFTARRGMIFVFISFIISIIFTVVRIALAPTIAPASDIAVRVKGDYVLMLAQCIFGALAMMLPGYVRRNAGINVPNSFMIAYAFFLYCAIFLGEVRNFYYLIPQWDTVLHTFSGAALGMLGFSFVTLLNRSDSVAFSLSPVFVALFAFGFAMSLGVAWEIYEFAMDGFLNTNMQKFALETGEALMGRAAVSDTMKDLIVDAVGAFVASAVGFVSLKYKKGWLERFQLRHVEVK